MTELIDLLQSSAPKAKRVPLELDFIVAAALALVVFYFIKRAIAKFFPKIDEQLENFAPLVGSMIVFALTIYLFNL